MRQAHGAGGRGGHHVKKGDWSNVYASQGVPGATTARRRHGTDSPKHLQKEPTPLTPQFWTSSLQFPTTSHKVCGRKLRQSPLSGEEAPEVPPKIQSPPEALWPSGKGTSRRWAGIPLGSSAGSWTVPTSETVLFPEALHYFWKNKGRRDNAI